MPDIVLIPPNLSRKTKSNAEVKVFNSFLHSSFQTSGACLHSLNIPEHIKRKPECEIDFLVVTDAGILCLEVKGGTVRRQQGVWEFEDRNGVVNRKVEGPFEQARTAMYSLKQRLSKKVVDDGSLSRALFGYGVIFPDIEFDCDSIEWDRQIVCNKSDMEHNFPSYIDRAYKYWKDKLHKNVRLTENAQKQMIDILRGDIDFKVPLKDYISEANQQYFEFTEQQRKLIKYLENNRRLLVTGPAGSGKTLMAFERVKYEIKNGKKVLLVCYNRLLADKFRADISSSDMKQVLVTNIFGLINGINSGDKILSFEQCFPMPEDRDTVKEAKTLKILRSGGLIKFDSLIIDEGQDILRGSYFEILNQLLEKGFKSGNWAIFYDKFRQSDLFGPQDTLTESTLQSIDHTNFELNVNCRNTARIVEQTEIMSNYCFEDVLFQGGMRINVEFYTTEDERSNKLSNIIKTLRENGVKEEYVSILTLGSPKDVKLSEHGIKTIDKDEKTVDSREYICVIEGKYFKGLENEVVIVPDITSLEDETLIYVLTTRAKCALYLLFHSDLKGRYQKMKQDYIQNKMRVAQ